MEDRQWEVVEKVHDIVLAEILRGLLEAQGNLVHISREGYEAAMGFNNIPSTEILILVPNDQVEEAKKVIAAYHAGEFEEPSE